MGRRWTWVAPNKAIKTQIDYFVVPRNSNSIKDFNILGSFQFYSDHRSITIEMYTNTKFKNKDTQINSQTINDASKNQYKNEIKSQIETIGQLYNLQVNKVENKINAKIKRATKKSKVEKEEREVNTLPDNGIGR